MKIYSIFFFLNAFAFHFALAQIQAPDFLCVKGDSLFWELPVNTCGPFVSYDVFSATAEAGPYAQIATVTDPAQVSYFDLNPSGEQRWYFLQSNFNCPGEAALQSDTLDNQPPEVSPIRSVSVTGAGGEVEITWQASPSPEVFGYIIYRETGIGVLPIDTVFGATNYLDLGAQGDLQSERYFVNALDRCGNTSIFDAAHHTVFLGGEVVPCDQGILLNWNRYENWPNGIGAQEVWLAEDGGAPVLVETLDGTVDMHLVGGLTDGSDYVVFVRAIEAGTGAASNSNPISLTADIVQPTTDFILENVTVNPDNSVGLTWSWNTNAEITTVEVLSAPQNSGYGVVSSVPAVFPLQPVLQFEDMAAAPQSGQVFYQIQTIDECGEASASNFGATIFLAVSPITEQFNQLNWTAFNIENALVDEYDVYRIQDGAQVFVTSVAGTETEFVDDLSLGGSGAAATCYVIEARAATTGADGVPKAITSRSNVACIKQFIRVFVPNAFAPGGINQEFKPVIGFGEDIVDYEMEIFDRNGSRIFFTKDIDESWRGKKDGRKLPQGVYVYQISVTQADGELTVKKGRVLLIR